MRVSREFVERCAAATGFDAATLEKVCRLGELAAEIARHPVLREALAMKGGTPLNLCAGSPTRLSVDLDYNFIGCLDRDGMIKARPGVERAITDLLRRMGYVVQQSAEAAAGRKFYATYGSLLGPRDRIEVAVNYLWRVPLAGVREVELWQPGELPRPRIVVVSDVELWVGKVLAFLDRTAPRDAWDVSRMPVIAGDLIGSADFRRWFIAMSFILDHSLTSYRAEVLEARCSARGFEVQLHPMLVGGHRPQSGDLLAMAWDVISPLMQMTAAESEFLRRSEGAVLEAGMIFGQDAEAIVRFERHPQVEWKLRNLRTRLGRG
jgi:hypothetical protein